MDYRYNNVVPYEPKLDDVTHGAVTKREYKNDDMVYLHDVDEIRHTDLDPSLNPDSTQKRAVVRVEYSDESKIRQDRQPNFRDRCAVYDAWMDELDEEKKRLAKLAAKRRRWEIRKKQLEAALQNDNADEVHELEKDEVTKRLNAYILHSKSYGWNNVVTINA